MSLKVDCVYLDPEAQRLDPSTRILLDRIQKLEDRIFAPPPDSTPFWSGTQPARIPSVRSLDRPQTNPVRIPGTKDIGDLNVGGASQEEFLTLPSLHNANTNNLYQWTVVQALLSEDRMNDGNLDFRGSNLPEATDIFLLSDLEQMPVVESQSWHLFRDSISPSERDSQINMERDFATLFEDFKELVHEYFVNVHVFYPILSEPEIYDMLQVVAESESLNSTALNTTRYCLLLIVLCLGSAARGRANLIHLDGSQSSPLPLFDVPSQSHCSEALLWTKTRLLLGTTSFDDDIEAAQCLTLSRYVAGRNV